MLRITVRVFAAASLFALGAITADARSIKDSAGRTVEIPDKIARVFAAGPPASTVLYTIAPETMIGWVRTPREAEKPYLMPSVRDLPELGRLTGRGDTLNLERLIAEKPDVIVDFGTLNDTYKSLADRVQSQTGIPYLLIDGRFENTAAALRILGDALGVSERGAMLAKLAEAAFSEVDRVVAAVPAGQRPKVYLARNADGLETGSRGSINTEIIERIGAINVVEGLRQRGGIVTVSPEQVIAWAPDTIITLDETFARTVKQKPEWAPVPAVAKNRVFVAPRLPFGFIDSPPSVNRLIGLTWLLKTFYPAQFTDDFRARVRDFYRTFYHVNLNDADLDRLLQGP